MPIVVRIASANAALGWRQAMLLFACERAELLLSALGLPAPIVAAPGALIERAQGFWRADERLERDLTLAGANTGPDERRLGAVALLNEALGALGSAYEERTVTALVAWAQRHYADETSRADLFIWSQVLRAAVMRGASKSLPGSDREAFERTVVPLMANDREAADSKVVDDFERAEPSAFELELEARQPELHGLVVEGVTETLRNERAWQALVTMSSALADVAGFLAWAASLTPGMGMAPALLRWPSALAASAN